jgi:hypothetical protein
MRFYGEEFLASRPIPKLEDHPLSAVRDCLFNIFAATLHPQPEDSPYRGDRDPSTWITQSELLGNETPPESVGTRERCESFIASSDLTSM